MGQTDGYLPWKEDHVGASTTTLTIALQDRIAVVLLAVNEEGGGSNPPLGANLRKDSLTAKYLPGKEDDVGSIPTSCAISRFVRQVA